MSTTKPKRPAPCGWRNPHGATWNPRGEMNPSALLTAAKVRDIRRELLNGTSRTALAKAHGVTSRTIRAVQERQTWSMSSSPQPFADETTDGGAGYVADADTLAATPTAKAWTPPRPVRGRTPPHRVETVDGQTVYRVAIENRPDVFATMDQRGFDLLAMADVPLLSMIVTPKGKQYVQGVRPFCRMRWVNIGRLLTGAEPGQRVRYVSGDSADFRRSNLVPPADQGESRMTTGPYSSPPWSSSCGTCHRSRPPVGDIRPEDFPDYGAYLKAWERERRRKSKATQQRGKLLAQRPASRPARKHLSPGEAHYNARLTEADVLAIRQRHADGEARKSLATAFAITPRMVNQIVARRRWKHLNP